MRLRTLILLSTWFIFVNGNLEGPFLFFGPKSLEKCRRPALKYLDQDELMKIYEEQAAIVVFNNQDSVPLSSGNFPRLRKMLEGLTTLFLPQDFLDVHPDYISNETQVLTLQGPWSERDAQMTETFARLQDIYGPGRVLGILGNSVSQAQAADYVEGEWARVRRQAEEETTSSTPAAETAKTLQKFALYNATGPPGKSALLYSTGWPELKWPDKTVTVLDTPVGEPTVKPTRLYTILVVRFADGDNTRDKVLTLQGPWSERDAQMTETFARLQDIYGPGRVLGILGNSVSQAQAADYVEGEWARVRRQAEEETTSSTPAAETAKTLQKFALYNATGPPGKSALLYSTGWPELKWPDKTVTVLDTPVGEPTVKPTRLYTILVVRFADGDNTRDKITLEFSFKQTQGWWMAVGVEVKRGVETTGLNLQAPAPPDAPSAVLGHAYHCSLPLVYASEDASLTLPNIRMQPFMDSTEKFADAFDCIGFTTVPIWSGLMVTFVMGVGLFFSISMIMDIKTMDRFETSRSKQLTITVND